MADTVSVTQADATEVLQGMLGKRRQWLASCERMLELLAPEWERFEARAGHDVYVARLYADHTSEARTHRKEIAALEAALTSTQPAPAFPREEVARETQAVWRCGIGDVTGALDVLKNQWVNSRRKNEREAGATLAKVCDLIWAARGPAPSTYREAATAGKQLIDRVRSTLLQGKQP